MQKQFKKYLKLVKAFSIFVLACTVCLWGALWISSATPSSSSKDTTEKVTDFVDSAFNVTEKIEENLVTQSISLFFDYPNGRTYFYTGETAQVRVKVTPENSKDNQVVFSSNNPEVIDIDSMGFITIKEGTGNYSITAKLKSNQSIYKTIPISTSGENPVDQAYPDRLNVYLEGDEENNTPCLLEGVKRKILLNHGKTLYSVATYTIEDQNIAFYSDGYIYGRSKGQTNLIVTVDGITKEIPLSVEENEVGVLTELVPNSNIELIHGTTLQNAYDLLSIPDDANPDLYSCSISTSDPNIIKMGSYSSLIMVNAGEVTITFIPVFNPSLKLDLTVTVLKHSPESLNIIGDDNILPNSTYKYKAEQFPLDYPDEVIWTVIKGNATVSEEGVLVAKGFGKVVLRCQSTVDNTVYADKTINVKFFASAYMFVRKVMGHFGLSCLLGIGIFASMFMLTKPKWLSCLSPIVAFIYASISEVIQKFTPGRHFAWTDIQINFEGALLGLLIAIVLFAIILIPWYFINKESFNRLKTTFKFVWIGNVFKSTDKILKEMEDSAILNQVTAIDDKNN